MAKEISVQESDELNAARTRPIKRIVVSACRQAVCILLTDGTKVVLEGPKLQAVSVVASESKGGA